MNWSDVLDGDGEYAYEEVLRSRRWQKVRELMIAYFEGCQVCRDDNWLQVHHVYYGRLGREQPGDLLLLCETCHRERHGGEAEWSEADLVGENPDSWEEIIEALGRKARR